MIIEQEKNVNSQKVSGGDLLVDTLINNGVTHVFGIPGAKIDKAFDVLEERGPKVVVCRHEQNAALIAGGIGRITGKPGVCLVTSGPGVTNLATGLVTANAEGDPVVAIGGNVSRADSLKRTHQALQNAEFMKHVSKYSVEVNDPLNISEAVTNAFRASTEGRKGAAFVSIPQDVISAPDVDTKAVPASPFPATGPATKEEVAKLVQHLKNAKLPVFLLGMRASSPEVTSSLRLLLQKVKVPVVETFQAAGVISRDLEDCFFGRVGLFRNQPGDVLLNNSDLIVTIGYDPIEYDPILWNKENDKTIIHLDDVPADIDNNYHPITELMGNISLTIDRINAKLDTLELDQIAMQLLDKLRKQIDTPELAPAGSNMENTVHPITLVSTIRSLIDDNVTVTVDVGSLYIYMARYFRSYEPRRLLFSNGMQTLGVALPWAIAASIVRPGEKVLSMSGDGGFLFSSQELETAVRLQCPIVHLIWNDGYYDMVRFQQVKKYGKDAAVKLGPVDFVKYAESMGAKGLRVEKPEDLEKVLKEAFNCVGPVVVDIPVDYKNNIELAKTLLPDQLV
ncbi:acetolactate synthase AlsS [Bacillus sp. 03113]|uniref:acetolactate synthase AlsS n=1 Tax=Bacillus sp. 03113 TaxID=2578211 RepID=UPI00114151AD|nr:acetolactate synthase AlsS [Bacillus sp. 03113]